MLLLGGARCEKVYFWRENTGTVDLGESVSKGKQEGVLMSYRPLVRALMASPLHHLPSSSSRGSFSLSLAFPPLLSELKPLTNNTGPFFTLLPRRKETNLCRLIDNNYKQSNKREEDFLLFSLFRPPSSFSFLSLACCVYSCGTRRISYGKRPLWSRLRIIFNKKK